MTLVSHSAGLFHLRDLSARRHHKPVIHPGRDYSIGQGEEFSIGRPMLEKWIDNGRTDRRGHAPLGAPNVMHIQRNFDAGFYKLCPKSS